MSLHIREKYKIDYAFNSEKGLRRSENNDTCSKYPREHSHLDTSKGQLFLIADSKAGNPQGPDTGKLASRIIQKNYFTYPSDDIVFSLQRALDTANRQIYQYAQANGLHRKIGATISALVLTDKAAYVAHVGDCRIYRISVRGIEQLTQDHVRIIEMMPQSGNGTPGLRSTPARKRVLTRALGIKLGIKIDTVHKLPVHRDEYFVLCSDGVRNVRRDEIKNIVLSSSPQRACERLTELARVRGSKDDLTVQIIKIYNQFQEAPAVEAYAHVNDITTRWSNWPIYVMLFLLLTSIGVLMYEPLAQRAAIFFSDRSPQYALRQNDDSQPYNPLDIEQQQLERAQNYYDRGEWDEALKEYKAILRNNSGHLQALKGVENVADVYITQGNQYFNQQNWGGALLNYRKALKLRPEDRQLVHLIQQCKTSLQLVKQANAAVQSASSRAQESSPRQTRIDYAPGTSASIVHDIQHVEWTLPGLDEFNDYQLRRGRMVFSDNIRIKKAFHREVYDGVEVEVQAKQLRGSRNGKYGIIFAHQQSSGREFKNFYLFTVDSDGNFALQKVSERSMRILVSESIQPGIAGRYDTIHLRVKSFGNIILLYANGVLLKMLNVQDSQVGGVGLYCDPKLSVEFTDFKIMNTDYHPR